MPLARAAACLTAAAVLSATLTALPAQAGTVVRAANGQKCTKVGTAKSDRLTGTPGIDVICGRGGNDTIEGRGGNDVIDAGAGNDVVRGGSGNDRIYGGVGDDAISGDSGIDRLIAADGNDRLSGGADADSLAGGAGRDHMTGGDENDTLSGDAGDDALAGGNGDDDLLGGAGSDSLNGGAGTNWCDATGSDTQNACKTDLEAPQSHQLTLSRSTVDVSDDQALVTVSVHVTDDTGVRQVQIGHVAELTRGTPRDGWWSATVRVPRYADPGKRSFDVFTTDRVGRYGGQTYTDVLTVIDRNPDRSAPVVKSMSVSPQGVDVRAGAKVVSATVRITDDMAGVGIAWLCPAHLFADAYRQAGACTPLEQVSGTTTDGLWKGSYTVPRGAVGGPWNFQVWLDDASGKHDTQYYIGPDQVQWETAHGVAPFGKPLPGGAGRFSVTGTSDNNAPVLDTMTLRPPHVDVRTTSALVSIDLALRDIEGITGAGISIAGHDQNGSISVGHDVDATLIEGTRRDGVWRLQIEVAQGTPPGSYPIHLWVEDATHFATWSSPESQGGDPSIPRFTSAQAPTGTTLVVD